MMKHILMVFLLLTVVASHAQHRSSPVDEIITLTKARESTREIIRLYLTGYQNKRKEVPVQVWNKIASEIDYSAFINEISTVYKNNYTTEELTQMVRSLRENDQEKFNQLSKRIERDLYIVSNNFGKKLASTIEEKLRDAGY